MKHRIAAGAIIEQDGRFLLVRHRKRDSYDFWVAPGGGAEGTENLHATAIREVREECGLEIEVGKLAYIEELLNPHMRECKMWFTARVIGGALSTIAAEAVREHIVEAAWLSPDEFGHKIIFPPMLQSHYWQDKETGFAFPRYMGVRKMEFY